ncbi:MAG TPA: GTPase ObgE, partial [Treponemataceae bacterium]|nr:GTPase ObgE [Treponemataceae bacterium]
RFLKHISRSAGLAFIIYLSDDGYLDSYEKLKVELANFSEELTGKDRIIIANKLDLPGTPERLELLRAKYPDLDIIGISIHNRWGLENVRDAFIGMVNRANAAADAIKAAAERESGFAAFAGGLEGTDGAEGLDAPNPSSSPFAPNGDFMQADLEEPKYDEGDGGFGATVSLSRKRKGKKK